MQSSKSSKKSLKKEEEKLGETASVSEAPNGRSRSAKTPKENVEATSAKVHRNSPATSTVRVEGNNPGPAKVMAATAGAGATNGGIIDSVGVMAAAPAMDVPITATASQSNRTVSRDKVAHLAYSYWEARGFSHGMADEDWIRAEAELLARG
jgi:hypothetical protein